MSSPKFAELTRALTLLPGVGQKTAQRMAIHLLRRREAGLLLSHALNMGMLEIKECTHCHGIADDEMCDLCADDGRDDGLLCVVESASDVMAIEQSGAYFGRYFVLGGSLSPIDGVGAEDLNISKLQRRVQDNPPDELILALSATTSGQTTAFYIQSLLKNHVPCISRLAQGVPMGGALEYLDKLTVGQALHYRVREN